MEAALRPAWCGPAKRCAAVLDATPTRQATLAATGAVRAAAAGPKLRSRRARLVVLALIAEQLRHGDEIIRKIENRTVRAYRPSPGVIYPTLTMLEELGHATVEKSGGKKLYAITPDGAAYLAAIRPPWTPHWAECSLSARSTAAAPRRRPSGR